MFFFHDFRSDEVWCVFRFLGKLSTGFFVRMGLITRRSEGSCGQLSARAGAGRFAFLGAEVFGRDG